MTDGAYFFSSSVLIFGFDIDLDLIIYYYVVLSVSDVVCYQEFFRIG